MCWVSVQSINQQITFVIILVLVYENITARKTVGATQLLTVQLRTSTRSEFTLRIGRLGAGSLNARFRILFNMCCNRELKLARLARFTTSSYFYYFQPFEIK